jgi:meso-butanediol dehydrogenase / (S,S)-butanediol dehydrogenase / diacetyl reductase
VSLNSRFGGKSILVTGGASGIGKATAERLASEGAQLVIADINITSAQAVAQAIATQYGTQAWAVAFNAAQAESCRSMVEESVSLLGRLDVLCNIAGIMDWGHFTEFSDERWERMLQINLSSVFYVSKQAIAHLLKTRGNIVNMASAAGLMGIAYTAAYCAAKAGVIAITKSLAVEFAAAGVRVNAIAPGGVKTPMAATAPPDNINMKLIERLFPKLGEGELCEPTDIAAAVAYLASEEARFVTGIVHSIDGGQTAG